jgi:hypothetical protein
MTQKLADALQELAASEIQLDRKAIERLEAKYGAELPQIINDLGDYKIVQEAIDGSGSKSKLGSKIMLFIAEGVFWGSIISIPTTLVNPDAIPQVFGFTFLAGSANKVALSLEKKENRYT